MTTSAKHVFCSNVRTQIHQQMQVEIHLITNFIGTTATGGDFLMGDRGPCSPWHRPPQMYDNTLFNKSSHSEEWTRLLVDVLLVPNFDCLVDCDLQAAMRLTRKLSSAN